LTAVIRNLDGSAPAAQPCYVGYAQLATFAKFAFRPGNTALDRCGAAWEAVIDARCGDFLGLDGSSADKADLLCIWMQQTLQQL